MVTTDVRSYGDIGGWFFWEDRVLFDALLDSQTDLGTLVELGAYLGRSAVIVGDHIRPGERFVVIDLFGADAEDYANRSENQHSYGNLTRQQFEANYLALHDTLPEVIQAPSGIVGEHVEPGSARFVHIDASHLYDLVAEDVVNTRTILQPNGVVAFDDHSNPNTPGVAAAVWEAAVTGGLIPFAVTPHKLYGTWGDPAPHLETVHELVDSDSRFGVSNQQVLGHSVVRVKAKPKEKPKEKASPAVTTPAAITRPAASPASDWIPPKLARQLVALRSRRG